MWLPELTAPRRHSRKLRVYLDKTFSGEGAYDELVSSFLGINCDYDLPAGILAMDIAQKFRDLFKFKEHPILNQFRGSKAPWLTIVGKLTEVYQTVHLKEFTDFPKRDEKDPTKVFADIHFKKKSVAHEAYHLPVSHGFCQ